MAKNLILLLFCCFIFSCKKTKNDNTVIETDFKKEYDSEVVKKDLTKKCDNDSLMRWSKKALKERSKDFTSSYNTKVESLDDGGIVSIVWQYNTSNDKSSKDEYLQ